MDHEARPAGAPSIARGDWVTRRAKTLSLLTLDTGAWCAGFLIAAWARDELGLTPRQCAAWPVAGCW